MQRQNAALGCEALIEQDSFFQISKSFKSAKATARASRTRRLGIDSQFYVNRGHILGAMKRRTWFLAIFVAMVAALIALAQSPVKRPVITGVAHVALKANDADAAVKFYGQDLGFQQLTPLQFKVNDHQYIVITRETLTDADDRLSHIAFETANAKQLRDYLASKGVKAPASVGPDQDGNVSFFITDPEGHQVEFVEYRKGSRQSRQFGKLFGDTRVSERIIHAGFLVSDRAAEDALYKDILGFDVMWHGGKTGTSDDWIDMRVPDGDDWLEYMCNVKNPSAKTRGVMNHLALGASSVETAYNRLLERGATPAEKPKIGRDGKWQLNLYDADLTRAELMEPKPVQTPCCSAFRSR